MWLLSLCVFLQTFEARGSGSVASNISAPTLANEASVEVLPTQPEGSKIDCRHGYFDEHAQVCKCDDHWSTAGITDTLDFFEGVCEQFQCTNDTMCQLALGFEDASCPVPGWNCYCGMWYAFYNAGHGYELFTQRSLDVPVRGAECMGVMYAFSVSASKLVLWVMRYIWILFSALALLCLPFGRKRSMCDHQWPSLWNSIRRCGGCMPVCRGQCVLQTNYTLDSFKDDLAWTIYVLDVGIWTYVFLGTLYFIVMFIWSVVLWAIVLFLAICMLIAGTCVMAAEAGGGLCDCAPGGDVNGALACFDCGIDCTDCCGLMMLNTHHYAAIGEAPGDAFYYSGIFPYDPFWGYTGYGNVGGHVEENCCCCNQKFCCRPIAWLIWIFPVLPENAWGGLVGYWIFGTHHLTPSERIYEGGNGVIEFFRMGWRRTRDLHGNESWRRQVYDFLVGESGLAHRMSVSDDRGFSRMGVTEEYDADGRAVVRVGRARAVKLERPFTLDDDPIRSSWTDYQKNECWICRGPRDEWDMWMSCRHLFCADCSSEMLQRRMPCPLCRVSSSAVLRGLTFAASRRVMEASSSSGEEGSFGSAPEGVGLCS